MGDLIPIFVQQGNIENSLQLLVAVVTDICPGTTGFQKIIPLFPYSYGMGLDPG
jgi:hypothetical protein